MDMGRNKFVRQILVPLATILTIAGNTLINALRLNGYATGEISDNYPNFFVPAGYVFAIWGVIYIAIAAYAIWQALPKQFDNPRLQAIAPLYLLSCALNLVWLVCFHFLQFGAALLVIVLFLLTLIAIYLRLRQVDAPSTTPVSRNEFWFARVPFSIYLGWLSVATIANATQLLVALGWDGFGIPQETWAVIMIAAAVVIAVLMFATQRDTAYLLVLVWAIAGIGVKQAVVPAVSMPAWIAVAIIAVLAVATLIRRPPNAVPARVS